MQRNWNIFNYRDTALNQDITITWFSCQPMINGFQSQIDFMQWIKVFTQKNRDRSGNNIGYL